MKKKWKGWTRSESAWTRSGSAWMRTMSKWSRSGMRAGQVAEKLVRNGTVEMIGAIPVGQQVKNAVVYIHP